MQVFEDDDQWRAARSQLERGSPRREELVFVDTFCSGLTDGGREQLRDPVDVLYPQAVEPRRDRFPHLRGG